jgi:hypothetical protein
MFEETVGQRHANHTGSDNANLRCHTVAPIEKDAASVYQMSRRRVS